MKKRDVSPMKTPDILTWSYSEIAAAVEVAETVDDLIKLRDAVEGAFSIVGLAWPGMDWADLGNRVIRRAIELGEKPSVVH